jgi:hypothetical protein
MARPKTAPKPMFMSPVELHVRWGSRISLKTLANWRSDPHQPSPPFVRFGNRILYPVDKLEKWEKSREYFGTRTYSPPCSDE